MPRRAGCPRATDALDNLVTAKLDRTRPQGPAQDYRYGYDPTTHRLAAITDAAGAAQVTLGYDARGNVTSKLTTARNQTLVFDAANRLSQVTGRQTYRYDGLGRRVQTTDSDGKQTYWLYTQAGQVLYSYEARRSQTIAYIYLGNSQIATRTVATGSGGAVTIHFEHTDALGSPVAESDKPGSPGTALTITRHSYMPYGGVFSGTPVDGTGYTGHVMDADTGLTYMQQRYYDPQVGRFISTDPMPFDPNTGANWNRYWYANNNPYRFTDPDGRVAKGSGSQGQSSDSECKNLGTCENIPPPPNGCGVSRSCWYYDGKWHTTLDASADRFSLPGSGEFIQLTRKPTAGEQFADAFKLIDEEILQKLPGEGAGFQAAGSMVLVVNDSELVIKEYKYFKGLGKLGKEAHHLIEKRFARQLGQKERDMLSVALDKGTHQEFTNAWRMAFPYGAGTLNAKREEIENVARIIYAKYPEYLTALGLQ